MNPIPAIGTTVVFAATLTEIQIAIENSDDGRVRICGGDGEDYDEGWARLVTEETPCGIVEYGNIVVAWDSGVTTTLPQPLDDTFAIFTPTQKAS